MNNIKGLESAYIKGEFLPLPPPLHYCYCIIIAAIIIILLLFCLHHPKIFHYFGNPSVWGKLSLRHLASV